MQRNQLYALMVAISLAGFASAVETVAADEPKGTKHDQQQTSDKTTTKSKLEGQKKGEGDAAFKELNKQAPGGPEAVPAVQGHNSGNAGTGTGAGTGNTGAQGKSGSGGSGSGGY